MLRRSSVQGLEGWKVEFGRSLDPAAGGELRSVGSNGRHEAGLRRLEWRGAGRLELAGVGLIGGQSCIGDS